LGRRYRAVGWLPFATTVQEFADRFQALACHAPDVSTRQRAELFVGGLPEHLRVDVEIHRPQDLQTAMYYARAFERRAAATTPVLPARAARPVQRAAFPAARAPGAGPAALPPAAGAGAPGGRAFRRLTPVEQQERRRWGLCYNCDELYAPGHVCPHLLYLAADDIIEEAAPP